jgi:hypothetical protein
MSNTDDILITNTAELNKRISQELCPVQFDSYRNNLSELLEGYRQNRSALSDQIVAALDGQPSRELRRRYDLALLRSTGTFFTGSDLASRLTGQFCFDKISNPLIIDPACGAGDLLVACAKRLPTSDTVHQTLKVWGEQLVGFDVNRSFVETARIRLAMLAAQRVGPENRIDALNLPSLLPNVRVADGTTRWNLGRTVSTIVVNPPFAHVIADKECKWAQGRTSLAALFIERCLKESSAGTRIAAILPDVLRTGSRYALWRDRVQRSSRTISTTVAGRFDEFTDVDVFLLKVEVGETSTSYDWGHPKRSEGRVLRDLFDIHVGPVVPFRLTTKGKWCPYVHAQVLTPWRMISGFSENIRFTGKTYKPPFVLVRRTSKSDYKQRCIGTVVTGEQELAIENHLLILQPKDGKLQTCKELLNVLKADESSEWMNQRIRCRHLTVGALGDLPWKGGN